MSGDFNSFRFSKGIKLVLQSEAAECGLACLAMIASYHRYHIDLAALRQRFQTSLRGTNLKQLSEIADKIGFSTRAVRVPLEHLANLELPCILHWDLNHFVVLTKVTKRAITIADPARGIRHVTIEQASKHFTGIALEMQSNTEFKQKEKSAPVRMTTLIGNMGGLKKVMLQIFALSVLLQLFALVSPFFLQLVVDNVIVSNDPDFLLLLAIGFSFLALLAASTELLRAYVVLYLGNKLNFSIAANLFRHLLRLPLSFFEARHIGDILSRFQSIDKIKALLTTGVVEALVDGLLIVGTLSVMLIYSRKLSAIAIFFVLLYAAFRIILFAKIRQYEEEAIVAKAKERSHFMESIRAIQSIKLFNKESQRYAIWQNNYFRAMNAEVITSKYDSIFKTTNTLFYGIQSVVVIYFGALAVMSEQFSVGMLFAFLAYMLQFSTKSSALTEKLIEYRMLALHLQRISDIALSEAEQNLNLEIGSPFEVKGVIKLESVSFRYGLDNTDLIRAVSHTFEQGSSTAIVGASGSGKTTLMKLIVGLLQPNAGKILVDGVEIGQYGLENYRKYVATVMQDDQLISGSLLENITFFDAAADHEHAMHCAQLVQIHDDILAMPMGYHSLVGEMGTVLSGGQRQRILLARALYRRPKVLLLDEATSHLDQHLESLVNQEINKLSITRIIIAHRKETIASADTVISLTHGRLEIVEAQ